MSEISIEQAMHAGLRHHEAGRLAEAETIYRQVLAKHPDHPIALHLLGVIAGQAGQPDMAIKLIRRAIEIWPNESTFHNNLGKFLMDRGDFEEAAVALRRAIEINPSDADAHNNMGFALAARGKFADAIESYREALRIAPGHWDAHNNLGIAFKNTGRLEEAIASYREALRLNPKHAGAYNNLSNVLQMTSRWEEAVALCRRAIELNHPRQAEFHSNLVMMLNYLPTSTRQSVYEEARKWGERHADPLIRFSRPHENERDPEKRMRVGFVSGDFREHPSAVFFEQVLLGRDRAKMEVFCYAQVIRTDEVTQKLQGLADHWRSTVGVSDEAAAEMIRADGIDVLVDLSLHSGDNRLLVFARRPAPVSVTWLAYPGTTGMRAMNYRLTDPYLDSPAIAETYCSEDSIWMPDTFWCYGEPENAPEVNELPAASAGFVTFGCLNNFSKVTQGTLEAWSGVLSAVPESRLMVHANEGSHRDRALAFFAGKGIAAGRVEFVGRTSKADYLKAYQRIDVGLDPFPCAGGTTTCDALWMGVPVVTLAGQTVVGRCGVSILSNVGLPEFITRSTQEYVEKAVSMAGDWSKLAKLRATLRKRMRVSPVMDTLRFAIAMERALRDMWRRWCKYV